ncbi:MAG: hypothetical protein K8L99_01005 [Anaerolineae bacterium]|nr:hypothetical protein [Anaerolineae bacterium]
MPWRDVQALHIYYPVVRLFPNGGFNANWGNEIIGKVIKPIVEEYAMRWLWITRYNQPVAETPHLGTIPPDYQYHHPDVPDTPLNAFILFRLSIEDKSVQQRATELARAAGYFVVDWRDYDVVQDLGSNRFIREDASDTERVERAYQIAMFMDTVAKLLVHSLREENGEWRVEPNSDKALNPDGSFFQSVHHLFCNTTEVPLFVQVRSPFANVRAQVRF